jgi:hypothetical protein
MFETSITTGKVVTSGEGPNTSVQKKLYVKVFAGEFSVRPPTPKKAKVLLGELVIKYSAREWPEKKYGSLIDDPGFLNGVSQLLKAHNIENNELLSYSSKQYDMRDTITLKVGTKLAQELIDRGLAKLTK